MAVLKDLIVHGPSRFLNATYFNQIEANAIKADSGIFNQLIATTLEAKNAHIDELTANNATVFGVMDVKGKLQTNQWEAASIANVGGNFYISPTGKSSTGTVTITRTSTATSTAAAKYSVEMSGTFGVSSTSSTIWTAGAYGMATGNVSVGTKKYPLGTCDGPLSNITTGTNTITGFTISNIESAVLDIIFDENPSLISSNAISGQSGSDLQVSVYLGKSGSNYMPIGILLTSYGKDDRQYIDIYDGEHSSGTSTTGFAEPVVRIGDLNGLSSYTQSGKYTITPSGWGIYTTQGYFRGEIYSELGYIGGFTINDTALYNGTTGINNTTSGVYLGYTKSGSTVSAAGLNVSGGSAATTITFSSSNFTKTINGTSYNTLRAAVGSNFGMDSSGNIYANGANITSINAENISAGDIAAERIQTYLLTALDAKLDTLTSTTANVGLWTIAQGTISTGTFGNSGSMFLSTGKSGTISNLNSNSQTWVITAGNQFGVTSAGMLYATGAKISGALNATSLSTGSKTASTTGTGTYIDSSGNIYAGSGSTNNFTVTSAGALTATEAILKGVTIKDASGNDRIIADSTGIIFKNGTKTQGKIDGSGLILYNGEGTNDSNITGKFTSNTIEFKEGGITKFKVGAKQDYTASLTGTGITKVTTANKLICTIQTEATSTNDIDIASAWYTTTKNGVTYDASITTTTSETFYYTITLESIEAEGEPDTAQTTQVVVIKIYNGSGRATNTNVGLLTSFFFDIGTNSRAVSTIEMGYYPNVEQNPILAVGMGTSTSPANAFTVEKNGAITSAGSISAGGTIINDSDIQAGRYLISSSRIYMPNNCSIRGMKNDHTIDDYLNSGTSVRMAFVNTNNNVIIGDANYRTILRGSDVYLNNFYKITTIAFSVASGSAGTVSSTTKTISGPSGFDAVGMVGYTSASSSIVPFNCHVVSNTSFTAGFRRLASTSSEYTVTFYILWLNASPVADS